MIPCEQVYKAGTTWDAHFLFHENSFMIIGKNWWNSLNIIIIFYSWIYDKKILWRKYAIIVVDEKLQKENTICLYF